MATDWELRDGTVRSVFSEWNKIRQALGLRAGHTVLAVIALASCLAAAGWLLQERVLARHGVRVDIHDLLEGRPTDEAPAGGPPGLLARSAVGALPMLAFLGLASWFAHHRNRQR